MRKKSALQLAAFVVALASTGARAQESIVVPGTSDKITPACIPASQGKKILGKAVPPLGAGFPDINFMCSNQAALLPTSTLPERSEALKEPIVGVKHVNDGEARIDINSLIRDLIWPIVVLILAFSFRGTLQSLIARILKFKHKDTELEFIGKTANESLAKMAHGGYLGSVNIDAVFASVKFNDWATLVLARMLMRKGLVNVVGENHGLGDSPSLDKLIGLCRTMNLLPSAQLDELERLREVTFFAEWWHGRRPTKGEWKWALANCKSVIEKLFDKESIV